LILEDIRFKTPTRTTTLTDYPKPTDRGTLDETEETPIRGELPPLNSSLAAFDFL
jgi:hypothetical protein